MGDWGYRTIRPCDGVGLLVLSWSDYLYAACFGDEKKKRLTSEIEQAVKRISLPSRVCRRSDDCWVVLRYNLHRPCLLRGVHRRLCSRNSLQRLRRRRLFLFQYFSKCFHFHFNFGCHRRLGGVHFNGAVSPSLKATAILGTTPSFSMLLSKLLWPIAATALSTVVLNAAHHRPLKKSNSR